jgi:SCO1/SenC
VPAGIVLEGTRFPRALSRYTTGAITLLAFFYSYCADPNSCPLAWDAFEAVREGIIARPELHGRVRLVFMSLDPARDTPGMLMGFARRYEASASIAPWHFLTTYSNLFLKPVLRDMGEEISIDRETSSGGGVVINHLLKVFLIENQVAPAQSPSENPSSPHFKSAWRPQKSARLDRAPFVPFADAPSRRLPLGRLLLGGEDRGVRHRGASRLTSCGICCELRGRRGRGELRR